MTLAAEQYFMNQQQQYVKAQRSRFRGKVLTNGGERQEEKDCVKTCWLTDWKDEWRKNKAMTKWLYDSTAELEVFLQATGSHVGSFVF